MKFLPTSIIFASLLASYSLIESYNIDTGQYGCTFTPTQSKENLTTPSAICTMSTITFESNPNLGYSFHIISKAFFDGLLYGASRYYVTAVFFLGNGYERVEMDEFTFPNVSYVAYPCMNTPSNAPGAGVLRSPGLTHFWLAKCNNRQGFTHFSELIPKPTLRYASFYGNWWTGLNPDIPSAIASRKPGENVIGKPLDLWIGGNQFDCSSPIAELGKLAQARKVNLFTEIRCRTSDGRSLFLGDHDWSEWKEETSAPFSESTDGASSFRTPVIKLSSVAVTTKSPSSNVDSRENTRSASAKCVPILSTTLLFFISLGS